MTKQKMTTDEARDMTVAVAQAYVDQYAQQFEQLGFTPIQLHKIKDNALQRFNAWLLHQREGNETE